MAVFLLVQSYSEGGEIVFSCILGAEAFYLKIGQQKACNSLILEAFQITHSGLELLE